MNVFYTYNMSDNIKVTCVTPCPLDDKDNLEEKTREEADK